MLLNVAEAPPMDERLSGSTTFVQRHSAFGV
jgi:hypothetical protein